MSTTSGSAFDGTSGGWSWRDWYPLWLLGAHTADPLHLLPNTFINECVTRHGVSVHALQDCHIRVVLLGWFAGSSSSAGIQIVLVYLAKAQDGRSVTLRRC